MVWCSFQLPFVFQWLAPGCDAQNVTDERVLRVDDAGWLLPHHRATR